MTNSSIIFVEVKIFWESILFYAEISANINWHILLHLNFSNYFNFLWNIANNVFPFLIKISRFTA